MAKVVQIEVQIRGIRGAVTDAGSLKKAIKATNEELGKTEFGTQAYKRLQDQLGGLKAVQKQVRDDTRKSQQAFEAAAKSGTGSYRALNAQLVKLRNEYKSLSEADRNSKLGQGMVKDIQRLDKNLKGLDKNIGSYQRNIGNYTSAFKNFGRALTGGLLVGGIAEVGQAVRATIDTFKEFSQAVATLGAISGATGPELESLENDARRLGESSQFTATQVVGLQTALARLGFSSREILQATEPIANLAIATGEDIEKSAKVIGQSIRAYGLEASEAGRVADVLAASFNSSGLQLETFAEASKLLAPVSRSLGVGIEESVAAIALLADNGLEGTIATQTLRTSFQRLADDTKKYAASAKEAGVEVFNQQGEFVGLTQFIENLTTATADMTEQERLATLTRIVGQQAAGNFAILLNGTKNVVTETGEATLQGADALRAYTQELENSAGAAKATADIVGDTLAQDLLKAESAIEGLQLNLVELGDGALRSLVQGFTAFVSFISTNIQPAFRIIGEALAPVREAFGRLFAALGTGNGILSKLTGLLVDGLVIALNVTGSLLGRVVDIGAGVVLFFKNLSESSGVVGKAVRGAIVAFKALIGTVVLLPAILSGVAGAIGALPEAFANTFEQIKLAGRAFLTDLKTVFSADTLRKIITGNFDQINFSAGDVFRRQAEQIKGFGGTIAKGFQDGFDEATRNTSFGKSAIDQLEEQAGQPATDAGVKTGAAFSEGLAKGVADNIDPVTNEASKAAKDISDSVESISAEISRLKKELEGEDKDSEIRKKIEAIAELEGKLEATKNNIERIRQELEVAGTAAVNIPVDFGGAKGEIQDIISLQKQGISDIVQIQQDQSFLQKENFANLLGDLQAGVEFAQTIYQESAQVIDNITEAQTNNRINALKKQYDREIELAEGNEEEQVRLREEFDEKKREIEQAAFERGKKLAILGAVINGASAIVSTLAANPGFGTDILTLGVLRGLQVGFVVAQTAAQIAAISSQTFEGAHGLLIPELAEGGTVTMNTTAKGRSHAAGHIKTSFHGQPVRIENGEFVTKDEHGNVAVINKQSSRMHSGLLNRIARKRFRGKGAVLSAINTSFGGIPLGEDGLMVGPNLAPFYMPDRSTPSGPGQINVTLSSDQINAIAQSVAQGAKAGTMQGVSEGAEVAQRKNERRTTLNERIQ